MASPLHTGAFENWDKFLNPQKLKSNLIHSSIFLSAYELLYQSVVEQLRSFYLIDVATSVAPSYKAQVVDLHPKDLFHASCLWLLKHNAISQDDIEKIAAIRRHRNDIAHELFKYLADASHCVSMEHLEYIYQLVSKIDRWWIREVEFATNPDFDGQDTEKITDDDILSGGMMVMQIILKVMLGQEDQLSEMHQMLVQNWKSRKGIQAVERD